MNKQSFGGGYGINRKVGGASTLGVAVPPLKSVTIRPGLGKQLPGSGKSGKHFQGAKIYKNK